jgi:hypothetical protein
MCRTMTVTTLRDYLYSAHTTLLLCRAHTGQFALTNEEARDVAQCISLSIAELEDLHQDINRQLAA